MIVQKTKFSVMDFFSKCEQINKEILNGKFNFLCSISAYLPTYLSTYLPTYLSIYLSISLSVCLSVYLSIFPADFFLTKFNVLEVSFKVLI